jgi:LysR family hydrogen peroxide-inducible transcriptional activator
MLTVTPPASNDALIAIRPFVAPAPSRTIGLIYRRGFPRTEMTDTLADLIRKQVPSSVIPLA